MATAVKLYRDEAAVLLDKNLGVGTQNLVRVGRSGIAKLEFNAQTTDNDWIMNRNKQTDLDAYQPKMDQELACYEGDDAYDFLFGVAEQCDVSKANIPVVLCFFGSAKKAWQVKEAQIVFKDIDLAAGKIEFTLNLNGTIDHGTWSKTGDVFTFTAASQS